MNRGITIQIGEKDYIVPPLSLGSMEDMQEQIAQLDNSRNPSNVTAMIDITWVALKRNYPDMTREEVRQGVDLATMGDVMAAVMDISGLKRKEIEAGKATAGQSIGTASTAT
jgi:hypothetical protein